MAYKITSELHQDPMCSDAFQKTQESMTTKDDSLKSYRFYRSYIIDSIHKMEDGEITKITLEIVK